ncbi:hypothetical protein N0V90_006260 [Kalmusia sp. IMI 367209]|nr:hypothetical protein N0V90_006260 [Kalmusia sp. IMI 367209]
MSSDSGADAGGQVAAGSSPSFTEREMQMLAWAMQSLKSGPPDLDYDKLAGFAGMTNPRSAANAWAKIRNKLSLTTTDGAAAAVKKTPQKKKATADKADGDGETPKKTPRKRGPKKQDVDGETTSPKKRGRPAKAKTAPEESSNAKDEPAAEVKEEEEEAELKPKNEVEVNDDDDDNDADDAAQCEI